MTTHQKTIIVLVAISALAATGAASLGDILFPPDQSTSGWTETIPVK